MNKRLSHSHFILSEQGSVRWWGGWENALCLWDGGGVGGMYRSVWQVSLNRSWQHTRSIMCWCSVLGPLFTFVVWMLVVRVFVETQRIRRGVAAQTQSNNSVQNRPESHLEERRKKKKLCFRALCFALLNVMILWFSFLGRTINTKLRLCCALGLRFQTWDFEFWEKEKTIHKHCKSVFAYLCSSEIYCITTWWQYVLRLLRGVSFLYTNTAMEDQFSGWNSLSLRRSTHNGVG